MKENEVVDLPEGYKMTELGPLPEDWEVVRLGEVVEIHDKKRIPLSSTERSKMKGTYPYCGANGVIDYINDYIFEGEYVLLAEDGGFWKKFESTAYLMNGKFWVNNHAHILKAVENKAINRFLLYWFIFDNIEKYTSGTTRKKLNQSVMKKIKIPLPPLSEQKKIVAVLSAVQEAKEKTKAVIKATKELKKSLMKYLFTYGPVPLEEAENVKLKETEIGRIPEDWEVVRLGEVTREIKQGKVLPKKDIKPYGDYPVYGANGIIGYYNKGFVPKNKVLLTCRGSTCGAINVTTQEAFVTNNAMILYEDDSKINWQFLSYVLIEYNVLNLKTGSGQPQITKGTLINHLIPLPPLETQKKIASILSAVDEKIQAEENRKKALEDLFNTLLHNLMTGKMRVNHLNLGEDR